MSTTDESPQPLTSAAGTLVAGRYRILRRIGRGGLADVYSATDEALGREVALKVFRPEYASAADLRRQQDEVRILATRSHPSLVTLFDAIADDEGRGVLVLEYVKGTDVRERLRSGAIAAQAVAAIGADIGRALAYLHGAGVVHRDVSPANILLPESAASGVAAKLTDLGIARLVDDAKVTATGTVIGTAGYLSPEQAAGRPVTAASDVYSLGLVLLECLTGEREFPGSAVEAAAARLSRDPRIPPSLGRSWGDLLRAMTARDPARRPSAEEVGERASGLVAEEAPTALLREPQDAPTAPLATADVATELGPTRVLPQARPERPVSRPRRPALAIVLALDVLAAVVAVILTVGALTASGRPAPDPVSSYPAVGGTIGTHLKQLEHQVSTSFSP